MSSGKDKSNTPYRKQVKGDAASDPQVKERKCLACGFNFVSQWAGNRICDVCKGLWTIHSKQEVTTYGAYSNGQRPKARGGD